MPDVTKLQMLFAACAVRRDGIGNTLLAKKQDISNGGVVFTYHRNCRATFVSPSILIRLDKDPNKSDAYEKTDITYTHSHASATSFNLKENCFICGMRCYPGRRLQWSMVQSSITARADGSDIYSRMLAASNQWTDHDMIVRLRGVPNGELVAVGGRYHRIKNGFPKYTKVQQTQELCAQDEALANDIIFSKQYHFSITQFWLRKRCCTCQQL